METRFRVRYAETDQMGIVHHSNYLVWMEAARVEYCRTRGICYRDIEANEGVFLAVAEVSCRYALPARFDDEIAVRAWIADAHPRLVRFEYQIVNCNSGEHVATGETKHVFCGPDMKPRKLPEKYRAAFGIAKSS